MRVIAVVALGVAAGGLLSCSIAPACSQAPAVSAVDKIKFCNISVQMVAPAAYCSVWRSKCALPKTIETRDEIISRLYAAQHLSPISPNLSPGDITYLVDEAIKFERGDSAAFTKKVVDACQQSFDQMQKRRREENVTR
jgi:hypothetical protein